MKTVSLNAAVAWTLLVALSPFIDSSAVAQTPLGSAFTYQGRLANVGGPVSGLHDVRFRLYDAGAAGNQVGPTLCFDNVSLIDGLFTLPLDFGAQFLGQERFLEIDVRADTGRDCTNAAGFIVLSPRQALNAAPNALNADRLDGLDSNAFLQSVPVPLTLLGTSNGWIIRGENASTASGSAALWGAATAATGNTHGGYFHCASSGGRGVTGIASAATGSTFGGQFQSSSSAGRGVFGSSIATTGTTYGVFGESDSTGGRGVYGEATATSGNTYGVYGQSASTSGFGIYGDATAASGFTYGGRFRSASTNGRGVYGEAMAATGSTFGGRFHSASTSGIGVYGVASAATGITYGVHGEAASTGGAGVFGQATADSGITFGVYGSSISPGGTGAFGSSAGMPGYGVQGYASASGGTTYGVHGQSNSNAGTGVRGRAIATTGNTYGVEGISSSTSGTGVRGEAAATSGDNIGVLGTSFSISGTGVFGEAVQATGNSIGVYGTSASSDGYGVMGESVNNIGVYGLGTGVGGTCYGVYGQADSAAGRGVNGVATNTGAANAPYGVRGACSTATAGYAVFASGDTGASGSKSFRIDHPLDPKNKYLLHYCAESPEIINFYRGTATLDARGEIVVELPSYFATINKLPSYQLTAIGAAMPMLHVATEISEEALKAGEQAGAGVAPPICSFRIAGGVPRAKVSWEVKAVRNDLRVRLHGAPVERDKTGPERGKYQHPEYYGQPAEAGMEYDAERGKGAVAAAGADAAD